VNLLVEVFYALETGSREENIDKSYRLNKVGINSVSEWGGSPKRLREMIQSADLGPIF